MSEPTRPSVAGTDLHNKQQAFLLYTLFCGDAIKTAHALGVPPEMVITCSKKEGWDEKVSEITRLRKSDKPGDLERAINRAINYVQAHRYRQQLERVLQRIMSWDPNKFDDLLVTTSTDKLGNIKYQFSTRAFADLASAMERAHMLTYMALGDLSQDRSRRKEDIADEGVIAATQLHEQIVKAMQDISADSPREALFNEQARMAREIAVARVDPSEKQFTLERKQEPLTVVEIIVPPIE